MTPPVRVLVVDDEPIAAAAHAEYVRRVAGFVVGGVAGSVGEARRILADPGGVDLILLDLNLPDGHGLDLVRSLRAAGTFTDVLAVTSARELGVVRAAVAIGVGQYLLKPFTAAAMRDKLERYARYRERVGASGQVDGQRQLDRTLALLRGGPDAGLPKGLTADTLDRVTATLRHADDGLTAAEVAEAIGTSRVTARRYLEYLADQAVVERTPRYGVPGRPELIYCWAG